MPHALDNYRILIDKVDILCSSIASSLGEQVRCHAGCSSCCTNISVFPVEAAAIEAQLATLPDEQLISIRQEISEHDERHCPLLHDNLCRIYGARPIICRTHGLPIVYSSEGGRISDCCPLNLIGTESLSGADVVDVDTLNTLLVAVNSNFLIHSSTNPATPERLTISEIVCRFFRL